MTEINIIPEDMPLENRPSESDTAIIDEFTELRALGEIELNAWEDDFLDSLQMAIEEERPWTQQQATKFDELKSKYLDT